MRAIAWVVVMLTLGGGVVAQERHPQLPPPPPKPELPTPATPPPAPAANVPVISATLKMEILLDRVGYSPGEIDGEDGANVRRAIEAFQREYGLPPTGRPDATFLERLAARAGEEPPLVGYDITAADAAGPFVPDIPADLVAQSHLPALGYRDIVEALGEKFHCSPQLLRQLNTGATFAAGEHINVPNVAAPDPLAPAPGTRTAATIVVSKATSTLTIRDAQQQMLFEAPVTTGSTHDPLPIGTWKVMGVQQSPQYHYNPALFWDANPSHEKALLQPGPNNPVGVVWIAINKEHYGIHGTPEPSKIGHVTSHGCVRLTNWDAERVASWARPGTTVIFQ